MKRTTRRIIMEVKKQEILHLMRGGLSKAEIAKRLNIPRTSLRAYLIEWRGQPVEGKTIAVEGRRQTNWWDAFIYFLRQETIPFWYFIFNLVFCIVILVLLLIR